MSTDVETVATGGGFLVAQARPEDVFTPEDVSPEERSVAELARDFVAREVLPVAERIEAKEEGLVPALLRRMGEVGLLGAEVPERYGGLGVDLVTAALLGEAYARAGSFAVSVGAHTGIGSLPIVYFGTDEQRERLLPDLASGRRLAAYALTEPGSGSDALAARTTARLSPDGRAYLLRGQKQWITNAGFADVFVVYAKVDGERFTAFIVERERGGLTTGPEVHKMGIEGSSTRSVFLDDAPVPVENVLGEVGRGHVIAFNILNVGRFKLGAGCMGSLKEVLAAAAAYASERRQFGRPIADFPLIQEKLAEMAADAYAVESAVLRAAGLMARRMKEGAGEGGLDGREAARRLEEFALECSVLKVLGSEALDRAVDEGLQIHGGYGYMREFPIERAYRDSRINRIFEGTNEINRLVVMQTLMRRAMRGLPVLQAAAQALKELVPAAREATAPDPAWWLGTEGGRAERTLAWVRGARSLFLALAGQAAERHGQAIEEEEELLARLADLAIELFAVESAALRAKKAKDAHKAALAGAYAASAARRAAKAAAEVAARAVRPELARGFRLLGESLALLPDDDVVELRRAVARDVREAGGYPLPG